MVAAALANDRITPLRRCYPAWAKPPGMGIRSHRVHRDIIVVGLALVCALALAACGSSPSKSAAGGKAPGIKFADCMRANGVPNFPDPQGGGGGIRIPDNSGINPRSPAFQSAQKACFKLLPGGGPLHGHASEAQKLQLLHLAQCMRRHGISTFPDPVATPPGPAAGFGIAFGAPGAFIAVPQSMIQSPGFQQAAAACGFPGRGRLPKGAKRSSTPG